MKTLKSFNI